MKTADPRIVFAGTPDFAAVALRALILGGFKIVAVYCQPDRPSGRGQKSKPGPVKTLALENAIPVEQPETFKNRENHETLASYQPDLMIVAAYGLILPESVLACPTRGCLNIHASLLPLWRGAAPIQRAIAAGDTQTGITIMKMDKGLDTGPMLLKVTTGIGVDETGGELHDRLAQLGAKAIVESIPLFFNGELPGEMQKNALASYAHKITRDEAKIDWYEPADAIARKIRAFNPWPVAFTTLQGKTLKIWSAIALDSEQADSPVPGTTVPGTILYAKSGEIHVACGKGTLRLQTLQLPGGRPLGASDILNGHAALFTSATSME